MSNLVETLKKPVGPLPLGAWFIVVGAGVGIGLAGRKHLGGASSSDATDAAAADAEPTIAAWDNPGQVGVQAAQTGAAATVAGGDIYTNEEWRTRAIRLMTDRGVPAGTAMSAVSKAYGGQPLNVAEYAAVELAIRSLGPPPSEIPALTREKVPTTTNQPPASVPAAANRPPVTAGQPMKPAQPAPRPAARAYTVASGDTLSGIGRRFGVDWHRIYTLNAGTIEATARSHGRPNSDGGHWIYPGEHLVIS